MGVMEAKTVADLFGSKSFIIPEFQRHYQWNEEQCEILWSNLVDAFEREDDEYFLGSLVVVSEKKDKNNVSIVDGQQRLTSLLLLMKAINVRFPSGLQALENLIYIKDRFSNEEKSECRIQSKVPGNWNGAESDLKELKKVLEASNVQAYDLSKKNKNNFEKNLRTFYELINEWCPPGNNKNSVEALVNFILDKVTFAYIDTGTEIENALRIFNTLNTAGLPLEDADIVRSYLYSKIEDKDKFVDWWAQRENKINEILWTYSYILQSKEYGISKGWKSLRDFFLMEINKSGKTAEEIFATLKKIDFIYDYTEENEEIRYWVDNVIGCWPYNIKYPYIAYMFQNIQSCQNDEFTFAGKTEEAIGIIHKTLRCTVPVALIIKRPRPATEYIIKQACQEIMKGNSMPDLKENIPSIEEFKEGLVYPGRFRKGLLALYHVLSPGQEEGYKKRPFDFQNFEVEHILPRNLDHTDISDSWPEGVNIDHLGNNTLLEKKLNIRAKNEYFEKKKVRGYENSAIKDVSEGLASLRKWDHTELGRRFENITERLCKFIYH